MRNLICTFTIVILLTTLINAQISTFDFTGASSNSGQVTQTVSGVTITCSAPSGMSLVNTGSPFGGISGDYTKQSSASSSVTFSFSQAVNIQSLNLINDVFPAADENMTFTPSPLGSNSVVVTSVSNANGATVSLNFVQINSLQVTKSAGGNFKYDFDDVVMNSALPVELSTFSAFIGLNNSVNLTWKTATEINNYGFDVERAIIKNKTKSDFEKIGFVHGHGTSNSPYVYSFVDDRPTANSLAYRLKMVDNDGSFEYSEEVAVVLDPPSEFNLGQNYPNPFNPSTSISFSLTESGHAVLKVYNTEGQCVATLINGRLEAGFHSVNFNAGKLASGVYVYRLEVNGKYRAERKMVLIK